MIFKDTKYLILKQEWFDMIFHDDKREEYREITPYWIRRLVDNYKDFDETQPIQRPKGITKICFVNGYQKDARRFTIEWKDIKIRPPKPRWCPAGTDLAKPLFVLELGEILDCNFTA